MAFSDYDSNVRQSKSVAKYISALILLAFAFNYFEEFDTFRWIVTYFCLFALVIDFFRWISTSNVNYNISKIVIMLFFSCILTIFIAITIFVELFTVLDFQISLLFIIIPIVMGLMHLRYGYQI